MELVLSIVIGFTALGIVIGVASLGVNLARARSTLETSWKTLYSLQQAEIVSLRNRLAVHKWEDFHNLQLTPTELDVASRTMPDFPMPGRVPPDHDTAEDFEERLAEAFRANGTDLEGDTWSPTVG